MADLREIKFRAWSEGTKEMIQVSRLYLNENTVFYENGNKALNRDQELGFWHKPYILMQYTGLKDKNGVEIYEGDILNINYINGIDSVFKNVKVIFDDAAFKTNWHGNYFQIISKSITPYLEVIGNIYENKELLED